MTPHLTIFICTLYSFRSIWIIFIQPKTHCTFICGNLPMFNSSILAFIKLLSTLCCNSILSTLVLAIPSDELPLFVQILYLFSDQVFSVFWTFLASLSFFFLSLSFFSSYFLLPFSSNKAMDSALVNTRAKLLGFAFFCWGVGYTRSSASGDLFELAAGFCTDTFGDIALACTGLWAKFLNQVCTGLRLARAWFLKIDPVWIVGMHVCVCVCCVCVCTRGY